MKDSKILLLAGLLHDIGKFYQRADEGGSTRSVFLSNAAKNLEGQFCPVYQSVYSHKHVLWTVEFIIQRESFFKKLLGNDYTWFLEAACAHHNPNETVLSQKVVQKADHYASGVDRTGLEGQRDADAENRWDSFKDVHMVSVFEALHQENPEYNYILPIEKVDSSGASLPVDRKKAGSGQPLYRALWDDFFREVNDLEKHVQVLESYIENIMGLLHKYCSRVPSSTMHLPDVSLFDHLKMTGAFAHCIHEYLIDKGFGSVQDIQNSDAPIIMLGGDMSGIQSYIYDIISSNAARNLKGRSFYLQIIVDNLIHRLRDKLEISSAHVVYASGGVFYMLAPNTAKVRTSFEDVRRSLQAEMFRIHGTAIYLALGFTEVSQEMIMSRAINKAWNALSEELNVQKRQRYKDVILQDPSRFFEPSEMGGKQVRDAITGEEFTPDEEEDFRTGTFRLTRKEEDGALKVHTVKQIRLGQDLKRASWWVRSPVRLDNLHNAFEACGLGWKNYLLSDEELRALPNGTLYGDGLRISNLNGHEAGFDKGFRHFQGSYNEFAIHYYGGNDFPAHEDGSAITFDELAMSGTGAEKLGVLLMDVDNLGAIFQRGLDEAHRTFSRYSTLSRQLDLFFNGYLNAIWNSDEEYRRSVYIVYSGGDDMFIVGHWNSVIRFAKEVREKFRQFTCSNPGIGLSGGMAVVGGKFPVFKAADMSQEAEKQAKSHVISTPDGKFEEKNSFNFLGTSMHWQHEFDKVDGMRQKLTSMIQGEELPRGVLQRMMGYAYQARQAEKKGLNPAWRWQIAYDFSRAEQFSKDESTREFYRKIKTEIISIPWGTIDDHGNNLLDLLETAARWSEMETK